MIEILSIILSILLLLAAVQDLRERRIPNHLVALIALVALLRATIGGNAMQPEHWLALLALFAASLVLFSFGAFGGGDAKLIPALALALPLGSWPLFLSVMAISGGLLALAMLVRARFHEQPSSARTESLPYGVAIAIGGWAALWHPSSALAALITPSPWAG